MDIKINIDINVYINNKKYNIRDFFFFLKLIFINSNSPYVAYRFVSILKSSRAGYQIN